MSLLLDIGDVVARTGVPVSTLHVWERHGLLTPAGRVGLRRQYEPNVIEQVAVIVLCQRTGFSLAEIAELTRPGAFADGKHGLHDKLVELREQRAVLDAAISSLEHALACPEPEPLQCERFRSQLEAVLPGLAEAQHEARRTR